MEDRKAEQPAAAGSPGAESRLAFVVQSQEDTDVGWGEQPESGDERLRQEFPPHWEPA